MAQLALQTITPDGVGVTFGAASSTGDKFFNSNDARTVLHVKNGGGSAVTVTIKAQRTKVAVGGYGDLALADKVITVPATTGDREIGPFEDYFNDPEGNVQVTYSAVTSVTVAAKLYKRVG